MLKGLYYCRSYVSFIAWHVKRLSLQFPPFFGLVYIVYALGAFFVTFNAIDSLIKKKKLGIQVWFEHCRPFVGFSPCLAHSSSPIISCDVFLRFDCYFSIVPNEF